MTEHNCLLLIAAGDDCFLEFSDPGTVLVPGRQEPARVFAAVADALAAGHHVAGWLGYELGHALEGSGRNILAAAGDCGWLGVFGEPDRRTFESLRREFAGAAYARLPGVFAPDAERYAADVNSILDHIRRGDVYQVNYTGELSFGFSGAGLGLFLDLLAAHPVPHAAYLRLPDRELLSLSPELFFSLEDGRITTKPMKGTAPREEDPAADRAAGEGLAACEKNRAENLMIVDLLRNDLGRIAVPGSIKVRELWSVETYATVYQLTSRIEARLREGVTCGEMIAALFPCGSVTGAPKLRAMQLIASLEQRERGVYTGAIGWFGPGGRASFNVAIRTLVLRDNRATLGAGGGIVHDSVPDAEYREALLKTRFLDHAPGAAYELVETMLWDKGYFLLEGHLARLAASAAALGFAHDGGRIREALAGLGATLPEADRHRIRLLLSRDGALRLEQMPLAAATSAETVALWPEPVPSGDPFLRHKTTWRPWYAAAATRLAESGLADYLFVNERGELTEGSISTLFLEKDGVLYTPPVSCGLLPGVFRATRLGSRQARERILLPGELTAADAVYIGNSVRGLRRVRLEKSG